MIGREAVSDGHSCSLTRFLGVSLLIIVRVYPSSVMFPLMSQDTTTIHHLPQSSFLNASCDKQNKETLPHKVV